MENQKDNIIFYCALIGGIADTIAIFAFKPEDVAPFLLISPILLLGVVIYLFSRYKERCDFLSFVEHLFENHIYKFTLLPKICMALDSAKEKKNLHITNMTVTHIHDFRRIDISTLSKDSPITYTGSILYHMDVQNRHIPDEFSCYLGDMYADPSFKISQKHGCRSTYEDVPFPRNRADTHVRSAVTRFSWQLKRENITNSKILPISFKLDHSATNLANSENTIVFYPRQYGGVIDNVNFHIHFLCNKEILKRVEFFRIWKDGNCYKHTPISGVKISNNTAEISISPCTKTYEAYYFRVFFELV